MSGKKSGNFHFFGDTWSRNSELFAGLKSIPDVALDTGISQSSSGGPATVVISRHVKGSSLQKFE